MLDGVQLYQEEKTPAQVFSCNLSKIFKKTDFADVRTNAWVKWTKKKRIHKSYSQENIGDGVLFSAVADIWTYSFSKRTPT